MRPFFVPVVLLLAGCAASPYASRPDAAARLTMRDRPGYPFAEHREGFTAVDGHPVPSGPSKSVAIQAGEHVITYNCPGWFTVDAYPKLSYVFERAARYELDCGAQPHIERVP